VGTYTRGLPADVRRARSDEIESDLWSQHDEANRTQRSERAVAFEIVTRLALGIAADVAWRLEQGRRTAQSVERTPDPGTRIAGLLAVVGGLGWAAAIGDWAVTVGGNPDAEWSNQSVITVAGILGSLALSLSLGGLGFILTNRFESTVGLLGLLGGACGVMSVLGAYWALVLLPLGSVAVFIFLARIHAIRWSTALIHAAAAPGVVLGLAAYSNPALVGIAATFMLVYCLTWIAVGLALLAGLPRLRPAAPTMR
jgi:hypothetical protein